MYPGRTSKDLIGGKHPHTGTNPVCSVEDKVGSWDVSRSGTFWLLLWIWLSCCCCLVETESYVSQAGLELTVLGRLVWISLPPFPKSQNYKVVWSTFSSSPNTKSKGSTSQRVPFTKGYCA